MTRTIWLNVGRVSFLINCRNSNGNCHNSIVVKIPFYMHLVSTQMPVFSKWFSRQTMLYSPMNWIMRRSLMAFGCARRRSNAIYTETWRVSFAYVFQRIDADWLWHLDLEEKLKSTDARVKLIVTDGVFSMDGNVAPLKEICDLADKHNALVFVDECHATGFFGKTGR